MPLRKTPVAGLALAALGSFAVAALSVPDPLPTTTRELGDQPVVQRFPVTDAKGRRVGTAAWRLTKAGGNCCEVLVLATRSGRLVEFGGTYPAFSDDQGRSWTEVAPLLPSTQRLPGTALVAGGGEGTLAQSPDGDVLGVGWDPYSGDRLQAFKYDAKTKQWQYQEAPLHEPFYDREWLAVAKGPFTINGVTVPWVSLVLSNFNRRVVLLSTDGLNYVTPTQRELDALRTAPVTAYLPTAKDPELDYTQPHSETGLATLAQGVLSFDRNVSCRVQTLTRDGSWSCFALPNEVVLRGPVVTDSRGWVHELVQQGETFAYRVSTDGGRTWTERSFGLPGDLVAEHWDFKVNGRLGTAVLAAHARRTGGKTFQDVVVRLDVRTKAPRVDRVYHVGKGDLATTQGVTGGSVRFDFTTVAILPDGKIAVSFADTSYTDPALAILV